ncbi:MAG: leucine-rich repeat protein, partial [Clostridia bacterium]|nr:leucine-rich repeat protein [Clostridia bacterium]
MKKRFPVLLCLATLLGLMLCLATSAAAEELDYPYMEITGSLPGLSDAGFTYSDSMLLTNSSDMSHDLLKASSVLSAAGYGSQASSMLNSMGYTDIEYLNNGARTLDNCDKVAYTVGHKDLPDINTRLWCVVVRGAPNNCEWFSSFNLGENNSGRHEGFHTAAWEVSNDLDARFDATVNSGMRCVVWLTGHSRGAAVANILAGRYTTRLGAANVFAYTFACPPVSKYADDSLTNIYNYNNTGDMLPTLPMDDWGYKRFGQTVERSFRGSDIFTQRYRAVKGDTYQGASDGVAYEQALKALYPDGEASYNDPAHLYATMLLAYELGGKGEVSLTEVSLRYGSPVLMQVTLNNLIDNNGAAKLIKSLLELGDVYDDVKTLILDTIELTEHYTEDEFADYLTKNGYKLTKITKYTGQTISCFNDLGTSLEILGTCSGMAWSTGLVVGCVLDLMNDTGSIPDAILDARDQISYLLYVNAAYFGYKGAAGTGITSLSLRNSNTTSIGSKCFLNCTSLASAKLNQVVHIASDAFKGCTALTSVDFPEAAALRTIASGAFSGSGVTSAILNQVNAIGFNAFNSCANLATVVMPTSVTSLGRYAFGDCPALVELTIPIELMRADHLYGVFRKDRDTYGSTTNVRTIHFTANADGVQPNMYNAKAGSDNYSSNYFFALPYVCRAALTHVDFAEGVTRIGNHAFHGCSALTEVVLPDSLESLGDYAFSGCSALTGVPALPEGFVTLGNYCFADSGVSSLGLLPASLTSISDCCFMGCAGLTALTVPETVTGLAYGCFNSCANLATVAIPTSVTSLGRYAFGDCPALVELTIPIELMRADYLDGVFRKDRDTYGSTTNVRTIHFTANADGVQPNMYNAK